MVTLHIYYITFCRGDNTFRQLGDGSSVPNNNDPSTMGVMPTGSGFGIIQLSCGATHGLALFENGQMKSWGDCRKAQCGYPGSVGPLISDMSTVAFLKVPVAVSLVPVIMVAAGHQHSLALFANGQVIAWYV